MRTLHESMLMVGQSSRAEALAACSRGITQTLKLARPATVQRLDQQRREVHELAEAWGLDPQSDDFVLTWYLAGIAVQKGNARPGLLQRVDDTLRFLARGVTPSATPERTA